MSAPVCYIANTKIDGKIASYFGWKPEMQGKGMNPHKIAALRGLYDQNARDNGTEELLPMAEPTNADLEAAAKKLLQFRAGIKGRNQARIAQGTKHIDRAYDSLRYAYSLHERKSRISFISSLFSNEVDRLMQGGQADRQSYVNGFTAITGEYVGGEFSILEGVYNTILEYSHTYYKQSLNPQDYFEKAKEAKKLDFTGAPRNVEEYRQMAQHRFEEYNKILEHWTELIPFVLKDLVKKEGVKLGIKKEFAAAASSDNFGDNDIAAKWELSESVRDGWQRNNDMESAFGSVGQQVRRILASVPMMNQEPVFDDDGNYTGIKVVPVVDDLGNQQFMDPIRTHQELQEFLKGVQTSEDMMARFSKEGNIGEAKVAWMQPIVDVLMRNPQARTQFFVDFKRNFQPYSIMFDDNAEGDSFIRNIKTKVLNKAKNYLLSRYELSLSSRGKLPVNAKMWRFTPVFDEKTKEVNWQRLAELRQKVLLWTEEKVEEIENVQEGDIRERKKYGASISPLTDNSRGATIVENGKEEKLTYQKKKDFLMEVFTSLGFDVTVDAIESILHSRDIYTIREQLEQLFNPDNQFTGFLYAAGVQTLGSSNIERLSKSSGNFRVLYNTRKRIKGNKEIIPVKEHISKILDIISKHQEGYRVESRVRFAGNTLYSFVNPSYLGDRLGTIQSYVENDNKVGLLQFLENEYLCSSFFVDDEYIATNGVSGRILNMWLADLVAACKDKKTPLQESVAAIFSFERDLGREDKEFEDFTTKEHGLDMFVHFFADEQVGKGYSGKGRNNLDKKLSALYPVFVLGDAGVSKYIRAPRIASTVPVDKEGNALGPADAKKRDRVEYRFDAAAQDRILEAFWDVYIQEGRRMALDEAMGYKMYANGKEVKHPKSEFSILTFLNEEKYQIPQGKESDKETIKGIFRQYLEDAAIGNEELMRNGRKSFKQRMEDLGILETEKDGKVYRNISSIATPENIDDKVREFYWNTKLATVQQLQIMTIDPSFYHGTKDLQKRYKEIHAPGTILDIKALDFDGNLYSSDGIERCCYVDDIEVNAEKTNPEFMEVILRIYALEGKEKEVEEAINNGIVHPIHPEEDSSPEDTARLNKIADLMGSNFSIYKKYRGNTLTDGQGWRSLSAYRKVMGMAGKWNQNQENAYKAIMDIRRKHEVRNASGKVVDHTELTQDERQKIEKFALVLQPIKPYMFTHEKYPVWINKKDNEGNDVIGTDGKPVKVKVYKLIPVQHKYAEALIIPELLPKGSQLRDLGYWMEANNIDMVGSTKIGKVGVFGQTSFKEVKDKSSMESAMSAAYVHELSYKDYRIQTNVPEHINASQLFGTQVRKLIMAGLNMDNAGEYYKQYLEGVGNFAGTVNLSTDGGATNSQATLSGRNLLALYNSLICANIFDSYEKFAQNAGNIEALSELLQQTTVGSMREAMDNILSYVVTGDERFMIPLFEGGLEHDTAALILSTFKKIVNKQQISGGSAVQVSAFGITGYEEDGDLRFVTDPDNNENILYAEIETPFDRSYVVDVRDSKGNVTKKTVNLPYDKYCFQDGYMIPTEAVVEKGTAEWKKYQSYTYKRVDGKLVPCKHTDPQAEVHKPLIEQDYPDILSILAYRIPTERDYSMLNCRIKRFTSKVAGGTIKVPPQGTTIAGFDFDIDKLYFMMREYHKHYKDESYAENNFSDHDVKKIWDKFYENNPEIYETLKATREEWEDKNPDEVKWIPIVINGVDTGRKRKDPQSRRVLNSFWKDANIEETFGRDKRISFAETAQELSIKPTQNIVKGEVTEWLEEYDFSKAPEENSRAARNNLLITLIQARLMDPQTAKQRYTPGGFDNASDAARRMRVLQFTNVEDITTNGVVDNAKVDAIIAKINDKEDPLQDPEPNYDPTDPYTMLVYNQQNQVAAKLIGIFANQNTNHAFASCMDVFELNEPIEFCGKKYKDFLHKGDPEEAARIDLNMAEFLAASVDAVKDPVLNFLNLNTLTADAGAMLARLGYNTYEIGLLFNQPVIRKVCDMAFDRGINITTAIDNEVADLLQNLTGVSLDSNTPITEQDLTSGIVQERSMIAKGRTREDFLAENAKTQLQILQLFGSIIKASKDVSDFVLNTKFTASNAVSSTLGGMYAQQIKVSEYVKKFPKDSTDKGQLSYTVVVAKEQQGTGLFSMPIDDNEDYVGMTKSQYLHMIRFNPFAYEQAMYDANRRAIKLLSKYFPYDRPLYSGIRDRIQELAIFGNLSEDDINDIHSNIPVALLAKQTASLFNGEALHVKDGKTSDITNREYYREKFAGDLSDMIAADPDGLGSLAIFKYLFPTVETEIVGHNSDGFPVYEDKWSLVMQDVGGLDADTKEEIRESWAYLMEVNEDGYFDKQDYAELGRDLFMYCYYQLGFDFSPLSFMHLAPTAVKDNVRVERATSLAPNHYAQDEVIGANKNDVYVWSSNVIGGAERASDDFEANLGYVGELSGNSFQLSLDAEGKLTYNSFRELILEAKSHPELNFKLAMDLTQEEVDLLAFEYLNEDIPTNVYFSPATNVQVSNGHISYGVSRTYREFLNEILDGKEQGLNADEFAQMWILNHLDNSRFVLDIGRSNTRLREIIEEITSIEGNELRVGTGYRSPISIDITKYEGETDEAALKNLVSIKRDPTTNEIISCEWCPCIKINGSYYLAESGGSKFNVTNNKVPVILYRKVVPWGCSKTIEFDGGKKRKPQMRYQSSMDMSRDVWENVSPNPNDPTFENDTPVTDTSQTKPESLLDKGNSAGVNNTMTRKQMENYIFVEYVQAIQAKNGDMPIEDRNRLLEDLKSYSDQDIMDIVKVIRQACRDNGVMMLNDEGDPMQGC